MKKVLTGLLAFLYLSTSMGATVHLHYCMGKLISWGLVNHESKNCGYCGMLKKTPGESDVTAVRNCCNDVHKEIKAGSDQKLPQTEYQSVNGWADALSGAYLSFNTEPVLISHFILPLIHAPPLTDGVAVYLLNRNFRI